MNLDEIGELSIILRHLTESPTVVAAKLKARLAGLQDAVPCYDTVGLYFVRKVPTLDELESVLAPDMSPEELQHWERPKRLVIPVCYEMGPDLSEAASALGLGEEELVSIHTSSVYRCAAVGFVPGFAYLGPLDQRIAKVPRLDTPRKRVEAGSVAIAGAQTAVYPSPSPGGWRLIGRTPLKLVDETAAYYPIAPGDTVRFQPIDPATYRDLEGKSL